MLSYLTEKKIVRNTINYSNMRYSIIIPIYNVEKYIRQCIDSVLTQTFHDYEIILVNDGSPDKCPIICDDYASKYNMIKVIHKKNGGLSDARNFGLDIAQGEYVMFLDSDDWWDDPNALLKINKIIQLSNPDIIICGKKKYYALDNKIGDVIIPRKYNYNISNTEIIKKYMQENIFVACAWDKIIKRELIEKDHQRFVVGQFSEDIEWCCKLLMKNTKIDVIEDAFYVYRQQVSTSITANIGIKNIYNIIDVIERYASKNSSIPILNFLANQYILLITNFMRLPANDRRIFEKKLKSYWWLIQYNWYPYVKTISKVKFLGFGITKKLLKFYYLYKRI